MSFAKARYLLVTISLPHFVVASLRASDTCAEDLPVKSYMSSWPLAAHNSGAPGSDTHSNSGQLHEYHTCHRPQRVAGIGAIPDQDVHARIELLQVRVLRNKKVSEAQSTGA